jgi:hypothetical protein
MNRIHVQLPIVLGLAVIGLLGGGCRRTPEPQPTARPTAFCDWCQSEKFGMKPPLNPQEVMAKKSNTNVTSGEIGLANYRSWTSCKTEEEARKFLDAALTELRRVAEAKGIILQDSDETPQLPGAGFVRRYRSASIQGTLEGTYEAGVLGDEKTGEGGKPNKGYWINLKLTEVVGGS